MDRTQIQVSSDVQAAIKALHPEIKRRVRAAIDAIRADPTVGEPLGEDLTGFRKITLGSWRVVYREERSAIRIHAVGLRATVYADLVDRIRSVRERRLTYRRRTRARPAAARRRSRAAPRRRRRSA